MPRDDYAILVGIKHYAFPPLGPLNGPVNDVDLFYQWLVDPSGGDVEPGNITKITTPDPLPRQVEPDETPPLFRDFHKAFTKLVSTPAHDGIEFRPDSRLYLYFSGHGFCEKSELFKYVPHAALYTANADSISVMNISGTLYAFWAQEAAAFGEIVLIMDCCRDSEITKKLTRPPLRELSNPGAAKNVKLWCVYAAPKGEKSQERPIHELNGEVHGLLTYALYRALKEVKGDSNGMVHTNDIKNVVLNYWTTLCGDEPLDPPEFFSPPGQDMILFTREQGSSGPERIEQVIKLASPWSPGDILSIQDDAQLKDESIGPLAKILLPEKDENSSAINWRDGSMTQAELHNNALVIPLTAGFYSAVLNSTNNTREIQFKAGGGDVQL